MSYHRVTLSWLALGRVFQNVLHFNNQDGLLTNQQISNNVVAGWVSTLRPFISNKSTLFEVEVRQIQTSNPAAAQKFAVSSTGTGSTIMAHGCLALKLRLNTALAGRKHRGRYYLAGTASGVLADDVIAASQDSLLVTACAALTGQYANGGNGGLGLVIAHKDTQVQPTIVTQVTYSRVLGIQRRRNVGVGI